MSVIDDIEKELSTLVLRLIAMAVYSSISRVGAAVSAGDSPL